MIIISKIFTALLLPPGCIIAGLLLCILRRFRFILISITVILYLLSIEPVSDFLLRPLENAYPPLTVEKSETPQAIVVLGGGTIQGSPEAGTGHDSLAVDAVKRVVYAYGLRNNFSAPYVFSGGKVFEHNQEPEAVTAERLFKSLGLNPRRFIAESASRNTWENAKETAKLGYKKVMIVTSAYHMKRSVYSFERNGMSVIPAPTDYKCERGRRYDFFSFMPSMIFLHISYTAIHEYIGVLYYRMVYRCPA
jgi:uncharacterized SAM-binding protein YcdF (DUF218 family)